MSPPHLIQPVPAARRTAPSCPGAGLHQTAVGPPPGPLTPIWPLGEKPFHQNAKADGASTDISLGLTNSCARMWRKAGKDRTEGSIGEARGLSLFFLISAGLEVLVRCPAQGCFGDPKVIQHGALRAAPAARVRPDPTGLPGAPLPLLSSSSPHPCLLPLGLRPCGFLFLLTLLQSVSGRGRGSWPPPHCLPAAA